MHLADACAQIVDKKSACLGLGGSREKTVALPADHRRICKFTDAEADDYVYVSKHFVELVTNAIDYGRQRATLQQPATAGPSEHLSPRFCKCKMKELN